MTYSNKILSRMVVVLLLLAGMGYSAQQARAQDRIPREYTNPTEVVTFDRTTAFPRALDVINEFSQEQLGKIILDRTGTTSAIGISIPPMHWKDALDLMLRVKELAIQEQAEFFEIITQQELAAASDSLETGGQVATTTGGGTAIEYPADIGDKEVRINAIFFEGSRRALSEIGVDWSTLTNTAPEEFVDFVSGESPEQLPATSGFENQFVSVNSRGASNVSQNVFNALVNLGEIGTTGIEVQALLNAFEADNLGEILASPSIKVMDGQQGNIQVGQDFSIKQRDFAGNVTDQFFQTGTILTVTPTVIEQNDTTIIHVDVQAERSSAQPDPVSTIVNKQNAQTQAILIDGEATAIAGLYRSEVAEVRRGIPILKDLPPWFFGLRYLFGYNSNDYLMRELVILIQAEIEPTIAERYGKRVQNKFATLNDERARYRREIDDKAELSPTRLRDRHIYEDESEPELPQPEEGMEEELEQEIEEMEQEQQPEEPQPEEVEEEPVQTNASAEQVDDPEIDTEPVPLNLGGTVDTASMEEIEEQVQEQEEQEEVEESRARQQEVPPLNQPSAEDQNGQYRYFVIGSSFLERSNAVAFQTDLQEDGFDAQILNDDDQYYYVAYSGYRTVEEARTALADIREYHNEKAWLFIRP